MSSRRHNPLPRLTDLGGGVQPRPVTRPLIASVVMMAAAVALTHLLWRFVQFTPFVLGFVATILSSRIGGRSAGMLALLIGVAGYALVPPPLPPDRLPRLLLGFTVFTGAFGWLIVRRYEIESELRASQATTTRHERRLQAIIDAEPACVKLVSPDGVLLDMNRAGLDMIGAKDIAQLVGQSVITLVHPDDQSRYLEMHRRVVEGASARLEFRIIPLNGGERWVDSHAVPFDTLNASGSQRSVLSVVSDVTERKHLEAQLRGAQKMEAVGRLAGGIAHDFNNLLTAIAGFTELVLLTLDAGDHRQRDDLIEVQKGCQRAASLTRQLLALSRRQSLEPRVLDINALIAGTERLLRRTIGEDIDIVMTLNAADAVRVDSTQFEHVLLNLALNARDAMPTGGQLQFVTESVDVDGGLAKQYPPLMPGRYVRVVVTDTGIGMSAETQVHVFEPFFTTKPIGTGTGLGLATVYGIVKQSDGYIWLDSREGRGTSVSIYLPTAEGVIEQPKMVSTEQAPLTGGSETILLVEDDGAVRRLANHTLSDYGYTVLGARDGEHALELADQHPGDIDLLVADVVMPGLSGPALAASLRTQRPALRVLYTSGYAEQVTARAGVTRDRVPLLSKPFLPADLVRRVRRVLDAPEQNSVGEGGAA